MALTKEILRHRQDAQERGDVESANFLSAQKALLDSAIKGGIVHELPVEAEPIVPTEPINQPSTPTRTVVIREIPIFLPERDFQREWERQSGILADIFAKKLKMSKKSYIATLPEFPERLPEYDERYLNVPLIVETRLPWVELMEAAGLKISDNLRVRHIKYDPFGIIGPMQEIRDWAEDPQEFRTPNVPYATWAQDGSLYKNQSTKTTRPELHPFERGGTHWDGTALGILRPDIVRRMSFNLIGSEIGTIVDYLNGNTTDYDPGSNRDYTPAVNWMHWRNEIVIGYVTHDHSLIANREIRVK